MTVDDEVVVGVEPIGKAVCGVFTAVEELFAPSA